MMPKLPDYVGESSYLRSRKLLKEAEIARERAVLIHLCSKLGAGYCDWHGAVEAFQHCFELSLKSLWLMLGLPYPHDHNPAQDVDDVKKRLFLVFPHLENDPRFAEFESWVGRKGKFMAALHQTSFYGDDDQKAASDMFNEEDVFKIGSDAELCYRFVYVPLLDVGKRLGLLTEDEAKERETLLNVVEELRKRPNEIARFFKEKVSEP
jgi:hypothetical protein